MFISADPNVRRVRTTPILEIPTVTVKQTNVNNNNSNNPPTLTFGVWEQNQSWKYQQ